MHCLSRGGGESENSDFKNKWLQIQFCYVLGVPWDAQSSGKTNGTFQMDFNSSQFCALFA